METPENTSQFLSLSSCPSGILTKKSYWEDEARPRRLSPWGHGNLKADFGVSNRRRANATTGCTRTRKLVAENRACECDRFFWYSDHDHQRRTTKSSRTSLATFFSDLRLVLSLLPSQNPAHYTNLCWTFSWTLILADTILALSCAKWLHPLLRAGHSSMSSVQVSNTVAIVLSVLLYACSH
jgi:hypothetical protein